MNPTQTNLFPVLNQGLFSTNFLDTRFLDFSIWSDTPGLLERTSQAREIILTAYNSAKRAGVFEVRDEQKTEDKFIRPVLKSLGWVYDPQPRHKRHKAKVRPDYALFASTEEYESAARSPNESKIYYSKAHAIAEAKYWGRPLNDTVKDDPLDARDATAQLVRYLDEVYYHTDGKVCWAILTNGKTWRLFSHRAASRSSNYLEVDLEALLQLDDPVAFRRFYGFFAQEALTPAPATGKRWVDLYLEESDRAARSVSDHLKNLIFDQVFKRVAEGFVAYRRSEKSVAEETDESLQAVFAGRSRFSSASCFSSMLNRETSFRFMTSWVIGRRAYRRLKNECTTICGSAPNSLRSPSTIGSIFVGSSESWTEGTPHSACHITTEGSFMLLGKVQARVRQNQQAHAS